jgi:GWxTD domain-containing protein
MKPFIILVSFLWLSCLSGNAFAQLDFLPLTADYATFSGKNDKAYTEIYVSFYQSDLAYNIEDTSKVAHFSHTIKILQNDSLILEIVKKYQSTIPMGSKPAAYNQFMDVFPVELESGEYEILVILGDEIAQKYGEYKIQAKIPSYDSKLSLSDIELSTRIVKAEKESSFSGKNNMEILPNPTRVYGINQPILYFYFEIYNLKLNKDDKNRYNYHYYISDMDGRRVRDFSEKIKSSGSKSVAEAGGTNIITLAADSYYLNIEIEDLLTGNKTFNRTKFQIVKPKRQATESEIQARMEGYEEYMSYTKAQLENEFAQLTYIATEQEKEIFSDLDEPAMRRFLAEFWKRRDADPTTPINEYKLEYFESLQYANATFASSFKEGWRTDQGRVLLLYGKPDEIERNPSTLNTVPYEIWNYYSLEGGSEFVFADVTGHGNLELLHSNYRNEIKDPNWRQRIGAVNTGYDAAGFDKY